jgi:hypothetical protein
VSRIIARYWYITIQYEIYWNDHQEYKDNHQTGVLWYLMSIKLTKKTTDRISSINWEIGLYLCSFLFSTRSISYTWMYSKLPLLLLPFRILIGASDRSGKEMSYVQFESVDYNWLYHEQAQLWSQINIRIKRMFTRVNQYRCPVSLRTDSLFLYSWTQCLDQLVTRWHLDSLENAC